MATIWGRTEGLCHCFVFTHFCPTRVGRHPFGRQYCVADLIRLCVPHQHQSVLHLTIVSLYYVWGPYSEPGDAAWDPGYSSYSNRHNIGF